MATFAIETRSIAPEYKEWKTEDPSLLKSEDMAFVMVTGII